METDFEGNLFYCLRSVKSKYGEDAHGGVKDTIRVAYLMKEGRKKISRVN